MTHATYNCWELEDDEEFAAEVEANTAEEAAIDFATLVLGESPFEVIRVLVRSPEREIREYKIVAVQTVKLEIVHDIVVNTNPATEKVEEVSPND